MNKTIRNISNRKVPSSTKFLELILAGTDEFWEQLQDFSSNISGVRQFYRNNERAKKVVHYLKEGPLQGLLLPITFPLGMLQEAGKTLAELYINTAEKFLGDSCAGIVEPGYAE